MKFPNAQRRVGTDIACAIDFREVVRRPSRRKVEAVEARRQLTAEQESTVAKGKVNQTRRLSRQQLVTFERKCAGTSVAGSYKLVRTHIVRVRPEAKMRIVFEFALTE